MHADPPVAFDRLVLVGFMGAGKTTVGRLLAECLGWQFADLDVVVAAAAGLSIPEIFARHGEATFRDLETRCLGDLLRHERRVIALGGGAPEISAVRDLLGANNKTAVIHLRGEFQTLYNRCQTQIKDPTATPRPLLGTREDALARYTRRQTAYAAIATYAVDACGGSPRSVAKAILTLLRPAG